MAQAGRIFIYIYIHEMAANKWCFQVDTTHRNHHNSLAAQPTEQYMILLLLLGNREYERTACLYLASDIVMSHL